MSRTNGARLSLAAALLCSTAVPAAADDATQDRPVEKIVVTASPIARGVDKFSKIVTTLDRNTALSDGGASVGDALMKVPGVTGTGFAPGANRPVIRGFDATRVLVTENGIGSLDVAEIGPDHGTPIDVLSVDRIEIVRGAATLRYGSQAIGGVVNILTSRIPDRAFDGIQGEAAGIYDGATRGGDGAVMLEGGGEGFSLHADGFLRNAGDYDTPDGRQANSFARMNGYSVGGAGLWDTGSLGAAYIRYDGTYGLPAGDTLINMRQDKYMARGIWNANAGSLQRIAVEAGYADYEHSEIEPGAGVASTFLNTETDGRIEAIFDDLGFASDAALGVQVQHRDFSALGEGADYLLPATAEGVGVYGFMRFPLGQAVDLETSARIEFADREGTPLGDVRTSNDFTPFSVAAGLVWKPQDATTFGFTASSAARVPGLTELYARGPHDGPATFETGDPNLGLERANALEVTARYEAGRWQLTGALWSSWYDGFIFGELTGRTCDDAGVCIAGPGEDLKELRYVQRDANFWGFEAQGRFEFARVDTIGVGLAAQADYVRGRLDGGENVPRLPPLRYGGGVYVEGEEFAASLRVLRVDAQNELAPFETPTPGYIDLGADISWRLYDDGARAFDLSLVGRNLTDERERNAVSFVKDDILMPGRDLRVVGRFTF